MQFDFYKMLADCRLVDKSSKLGSIISTADVVFKNAQNEKDMTVTLSRSVWADEINYCYVPIFNKYYFVEKPTYISDSIITIRLKYDYLMNNKDEIYNLSCNVSRSESDGQAYILDDQRKVLTYKNIVTKQFPSGITDDSIILMTVG